jgi:hypothetical protein
VVQFEKKIGATSLLKVGAAPLEDCASAGVAATQIIDTTAATNRVVVMS